MQVIFALILVLLSFNGFSASKDWQQNRVVPLTNITVGPWDNFEATINGDDTTIYYTRDQNQVSSIYKQNLNTFDNEQFIGEDGDGKQPVLNAKGDALAITYFQYDAQGDICLVKLEDNTINCITDSKTVDESPFWIDNQHLGFISRESSQLNWQLRVYNLQSKVTKNIHQGFVSAPSASPDGRFILFNESIDNQPPGLMLYDRQTKKLTKAAAFDIPGISGYSYFSKDGAYLYFNHYLNDTNGDQKINANDHSVVFRVPFEKWRTSNEAMLPEQLTSVEYNCKFPSLSKQFLYVTCAFKGSLDVYRLPLTGSVPQHWDAKKLDEAHLAARSYEERLLLLNAMRYRFQQNSTNMLERVLSNHLSLNEYTAASYFVKSLIHQYQAKKNDKMIAFYRSLDVLLEIKSAKQSVGSGIVTARFQRSMAKKRQQLKNFESRSSLYAMMNAYMDYELEQSDLALKRLDQISLSGKLLPLERYLVFDLYQRILISTNPSRLLQLYPEMFNHKDLSLEAKLYHALGYLKLLAQEENENNRIKLLLQQITQAGETKIAELFQVEMLSLQISLSRENKQQIAHYKKLANLLKINKSDLLIRKAMHTRAIQILGENDQFKFMELLSRHWLVTTHVSELEFVNVAEQYSVITMDKAYGMMADNEFASAFNTFYSAVRQTNELEAHYQLVRMGLNESLNKEKDLRKFYAVLEKQKLLGVAKQYVDALEALIKLESKKDLKPAQYETVLDQLKAMPVTQINPAMRDLLMAYIFHKQLLLTRDGYAYDKSLYKKAHHHYMLAMDYAIGNTRIAATAWENIGWLHFDVRQYALAANFFQHRLQLAFEDNQARLNTRWIYARALFYNNQMQEASETAEETLVLAEVAKVKNLVPYREKAAFYAMQAELYDVANKHYALLLSRSSALNDVNRAKALLAYGYALKQTENIDKAVSILKELLSLIDSLQVLSANNQRLIEFHPQRLRLLALGFLSKLVRKDGDKINYLQTRIKMLQDMPKSKKNFAFDEASRLSFLAKDQQQLALLYEAANQKSLMSKAMVDSLSTAELWVADTGLATGPVIYQVLVNYLSLGIIHHSEFDAKQQKTLQTSYQKIQKTFAEQEIKTAYLIAQQNKLEIIWSVLQTKYQQQTTQQTAEQLNKIMASEAMLSVKKQQILEYQALKDMVDYFLSELS